MSGLVQSDQELERYECGKTWIETRSYPDRSRIVNDFLQTSLGYLTGISWREVFEESVTILPSCVTLRFLGTYPSPSYSLRELEMGSQRLVVGNLIVVSLAVLSILGFFPWNIAAFLIIAVAVIASLPSSAVSSMKPSSVESINLESRPVQTERRPATHARLEPARNPQARQATQSLTKEGSLNESPMDPADQKVVPGDDYLSFEIGLREGEELVADVSGEGVLNVYLLTEENLANLDSNEEFWYEVGNERVRNATLRFTPEERGRWFLVIENCGSSDISARVKFVVNESSHPVPLLKSEKLDVPDVKLEGKASL